MEKLATYFIKKPQGTRLSWAIVGYTISDTGKREYFTPELVKNELAAINKAFKDKTLSETDARRQISELITKLYTKEKNIEALFRNMRLSEDNDKILNKFWKDVYGSKELIDDSSMRYDLVRALRLIEPVSLLTGSPSDLKKALEKNRKNINQHRRAVDRLNQILKYTGRDIRLSKPQAPFKKPRYLTRDELTLLLNKVQDSTLKDLYLTLFGTGMRLGEAMAIEPADIGDGFLMVEKQLKPNETGQHLETSERTQPPKRGKVGQCVIISFTMDAVKRWAAVIDKESYRNQSQKLITSLAKSVFSGSKTKFVSIHDLRHSHAIHLLSLGASLTMIALNLRNRIEVCQRYYTGFSHTDETVTHMLNLVKENDPKKKSKI